MAIGATAQWEARANASNSGLQGGFYVTTAGSTDYSQQDTAQLSLTDIASDGAGTGLSSATGGFTTAMIGNGIYISGGTATAGWYQITARASSNAITIDRSCGASKTGLTGRVGGATILADAPLEASVAGNIFWVKADATHTLSANISLAGTGTEALSKDIVGYNTTRGDMPTGNNRPYISCGAYYFLVSSYTNICNFRADGTAAIGFRLGYASIIKNSYFNNTSATANRQAIDSTVSGATFKNCEAECANGYGFYGAGVSGLLFMECQAHNCGVGGYYLGGYNTVLSCIANVCVKGFVLAASTNNCILNCTIHGNTTSGIDVTTGDSNRFYNNAITSNGIGISLTDGHEGENVEDYNNFYDNTTDRSNIDIGPNSISLDPQYTDADGGDFSIAAGSNMANKASTIILGV